LTRRLLLAIAALALLAAAPAASLASQAKGPIVLIAKVGKDDGYTITLTKAGKPVTKLVHGQYRIYVHDYSTLHNIRIKGPGVNKWTSVPELASPVWQVTFRKGVYTVVCDPHPVQMRFTFRVI
jgi:hypothetical protein